MRSKFTFQNFAIAALHEKAVGEQKLNDGINLNKLRYAIKIFVMLVDSDVLGSRLWPRRSGTEVLHQGV